MVDLKLNTRQKMNGIDLLSALPDAYTSLAFCDFQYRGVMDAMSYGNEGTRQSKRAALPQMTTPMIWAFLTHIDRVLKPQGHLMLWVDKFILCSQLPEFMAGLTLQLVDLITWHKDRMGMGYRTRRTCEYLVVFQKPPKRVAGVWTDRGIPDVWTEKITDKIHPHSKPVGLQTRLIAAVTKPGDVVLDPCAGGYSVMRSAHAAKRDFMGCDLVYGEEFDNA